MKKTIEGVGEVITPGTFKEKIQNFIYHYKWHSIVAVALIIAITICSLQFCTRENYDAYVLYAGSRNIGRTSKDGDVAEIATVISSLKRVSDDFDQSGDVSINFTNYYYLSDKEAASLDDVNETLLASDRSSLSSVLEHSEYYLCFISKAVYDEYHAVGSTERFILLDEYKDTYPELEYYTDSAIYLSSTAAYKLPGLASLPEDTLICIRHPSVLAAKSDEHVMHFNNAKKMLEKILDLKIK